MSLTRDADNVLRLVSLIRPILAGNEGHVQGAVLADLLAMWLAGHVFIGDPKQTTRMREQMLKQHMAGVRNLIDINYKMSVEPQIKRRTQ